MNNCKVIIDNEAVYFNTDNIPTEVKEYIEKEIALEEEKIEKQRQTIFEWSVYNGEKK